MTRILIHAIALSLASASIAAAQPDATTDVDASTTPEEQSPLAPEQAVRTSLRPLTIEDLLTGALPDPVVAAPLPAAPAGTPSPPPLSAPALSAPAYVAPPEPRPVFIDEWTASPDSPPTAVDRAYESRVLGVFNAAQGRQGPLDGRWRVTADGVDVYILQFADPGAGESRVEGAWRNVRRAGGLDASGFVEQVSREGDEVVVRFTDANRRLAQIRLRSTSVGGWTGRVVWPEGASSVTMTRDVSVESLASGAPADTPAPPP